MLVATTTGMSMIRLSWKAVPGATAYELEYLEGVLAGDDAGFGNPNRISRMDMTMGGNLRNYCPQQAVSRGLGTATACAPPCLRASIRVGRRQQFSQYTKPARPMLSAKATDIHHHDTELGRRLLRRLEAGGAGRLETQRQLSCTAADV